MSNRRAFGWGGAVAFAIRCPHCSRVHKVGPEVSGKRVTCAACKKSFLAPTIPPQGGAPAQGARKLWNLYVDEKTLGPYSAEAVAEQIRTGKIRGATLAWRDGMDNWAPLEDLAEFRQALAAAKAPPAVARPAAPRAGLRGDHASEAHEGRRRHHYAPGRSKRDIIIGAWVAGVMAVGVLIAVIALSGKPLPETEEAKQRARAWAEVKTGRAQRTASTSGAPPSPSPGASRQPVRQPATPGLRAKLYAFNRLEKGLKTWFPKAVEGHKSCQAAPVRALGYRLGKQAEALGKVPWGADRAKVAQLLTTLNEAATHIKTRMDEQAHLWAVWVNETPERREAELRLSDVAWLQRWETAIRTELSRARGAIQQ